MSSRSQQGVWRRQETMPSERWQIRPKKSVNGSRIRHSLSFGIVIDAVSNRLAECALGSYAGGEILEPTFEPGHERHGLLLTDGMRILQRPFFSGPFAFFP